MPTFETMVLYLYLQHVCHYDMIECGFFSVCSRSKWDKPILDKVPHKIRNIKAISNKYGYTITQIF